jgi:hypothetical protein
VPCSASAGISLITIGHCGGSCRCPAGTFADTKNTVACKGAPQEARPTAPPCAIALLPSSRHYLPVCLPGKFSPLGAQACSACQLGKASDDHGAGACTSCSLVETIAMRGQARLRRTAHRPRSVLPAVRATTKTKSVKLHASPAVSAPFRLVSGALPAFARAVSQGWSSQFLVWVSPKRAGQLAP